MSRTIQMRDVVDLTFRCGLVEGEMIIRNPYPNHCVLGLARFDWICAQYYIEDDCQMYTLNEDGIKDATYLGPARYQKTQRTDVEQGKAIGAWLDKINGLAKDAWRLSTYGDPKTGEKVI